MTWNNNGRQTTFSELNEVSVRKRLVTCLAFAVLAACASSPPAPTEDEKLFTTVNAKAATGDVVAEREVGEMYMEAQGTPYDPVEAVLWLRKAADGGDAEAQLNLGWAYEHGTGVAKDLAQAQRLFLKSAQQGLPEGENALGYCYMGGVGTPVDYQQALAWYTKASDAGDAVADANLGDMYSHGWGVPKDVAAGLHWYQQAAQRGNRGTQLYLAQSYRDGVNGVPKDPGESQRYFHLVTDTPVRTFKELQDAISLILESHKIYPQEAIDKHQSGDVLVAFTVADRRVTSYRMLRSSGYPSLDAAVTREKRGQVL